MEYSLAIKDIFGILKRDWKRILIIVAVCAALLGIVPMIMPSSGSDVTPEDVAENEESIQAYEDWSESKDETVEALSEGLISAYEYMLNDPCMKIDPYNCTYRQITIAFGGDSAMASRKRTVQSWVDKGYGQIVDGYPKYLIDVSGDIGEVTVTLFEGDGYDLTSTAQEIEEYIRTTAQSDNIEIESISNTEWQGKSQVLFERQDQLRNNALRIQNEITYYGNSTALTEPAHISMPSKSAAGMVKYALFGGILGLILGIVYAVFRVIRKGVLISPAQINDFFAIPELGTYVAGDEEKAKLLAATLDVYNDSEHGLFLFNDADAAVCEQLKNDMHKYTGKPFVTGSGFSDDMASAEQILQADGVIVPIRFGKTTFKEVQKLIKWAQRFKKEPVGYIVLDA